MLGHHRFAPNSVPYQKSKSWTPLPQHHASPCADPGIFVKGGGPGHLTKKALTTCFFFLSTADLTDDKWSISKKSITFQGSRGGPTFSGGGGGGVPTFSRGGGGSNCLFPIETHITCDFPGGPDPLSPPLDPHCQPEEIFYFKVSQWVHSSDSGLLLTM